jgi:hypothetical protein
VDHEAYDKTIDVLHGALKDSKVDRSEKVAAFRRLASFADVEGTRESWRG